MDTARSRSLGKSRKLKTKPELSGNPLVRAVVAAISDEALRHIAASKDITTCRSRIMAAAVIAHATLSQANAESVSGPSSPSTPHKESGI